MGNSKKKKKEQYAASQRTFAAAEAEAAKIKTSPEFDAMKDSAASRRARFETGGDVTNDPYIRQYGIVSGIQSQQEERSPTLGDASLATYVANPNLLAMNKQYLKRQKAQRDAENISGLAIQSYENAGDIIAAHSGAQMAGAEARSGVYRGLSGDAFDRYKFFKSQPGIFSKIVGGIQAGAGIAAGFGIPGFGGFK